MFSLFLTTLQRVYQETYFTDAEVEAQRGEETHLTPHSRKVAELGLSPHVSRASPCTFPYSMLPLPLFSSACSLLGPCHLSALGSNPEGHRALYPTPWNLLLNHFLLPLEPRQAPSSASISAPLKAATKGLFMVRGCHLVSVLSIAATEKNRDRSLRINSLPRLQHLTAPVMGPVPGGLPALISSNPHCNITRTTSCVCSRDSEIHVTKR